VPNYTTNQCPICGQAFVVDLNHRKQITCGKICREKLLVQRRTHSVEEQTRLFWTRVDKNDDANSCWEWQGRRDKHGYGRMEWPGKRSQLAHRISWLLAHGDPGQLWVLHECDNPRCCNPNHLFLGTPMDNTRDMRQKGRAGDLRGEEHPRAKVTAAQVSEIRQLYAAGGVTQKELGQRYGITDRQVSSIVREENWKASPTPHQRE
jgi:hypothetical protein